MMSDLSYEGKISPKFAAKLSSYPPNATVRAMVLLQRENPQTLNNSHRQSRQERKAAIQAMQESVKQSWEIVDRIVRDFNGKTLAQSPDALGAIPIEITPDGIKALASSDAVKAIMESDRIYPLE